MRFPPLLALLLWVVPFATPFACAGDDTGPQPEQAKPAGSPPDAPPQPLSKEESDTLLQTLRETHPWANWEPGAWRRVRVVTEAFDADRKAVGRSVTERLERLLACDETCYELQIEAVSQLSGRPTPAPIEKRKLWIANNRRHDLGEPLFYAEPPTSISLCGTMTPCQVWRIKQPDAIGGQNELLYLATNGSPKLLRRELTTIDESGGVHLVEFIAAAGAPVLHGESLVDGWRRVTAVTRPNGSRSQSISVHSTSVPGGLHRESLAEYDDQGLCFRWTVIDLLAAGASPDDPALIGKQPGNEQPPGLSIEIRPRRLLRLLRRGDEKTDEPEPLQ